MGASSNPDDPNPIVEPADRLDSWKEIAGYLGRTERTVRRWEQTEGLPVHRLMHDKGGSVYAYRGELDIWRTSREQTTGPEEITPASRLAPNRRKLWISIAALLLITLAGTAAATRYWLTRPSYSSIAVLPFENLSHDPGQEWFSDGMTETLITELSKVRSLKVISRTSVMQYKGVRKPLKQIAAELGVDAIVEGSALRVGDHVRITAQLIATSSDTHLWGKDFDADMKDVLGLQRVVARSIAAETGARLTSGERRQLAAPAPQVNPQAMSAYLSGLYQFNRSVLREALPLAREAVRIEPQFAPAHELLGMILENAADFHVKPYAEILPEARAELERALQIDPDRGVSYYWLGETYFFGQHDWAQGEANMRRGFELDPSTGAGFGFLLAAQGKLDEATHAVEQALASDPANPSLLQDSARVYEFAGRYDDSIRLYRKAVQLNPGQAYASTYLPMTLLMAGRQEEALEAWEGLGGHGPFAHASEYRDAFKRGGWPAVWLLYLELVPDNSNWPVLKRWALVFLHRDSEALDMLEQLEKRGDSWMVQLEDPVYDDLRKQPRFKALMKRVGYPEAAWH